MRKEKSTLLKRLNQYSAVAGSILSLPATAVAQMSYTDIDPDVTLTATAGGETYNLDVNNNGTVDYIFHAKIDGQANHIGVVMYPYYNSQNFDVIAGRVQASGGDFFGYPYAIAQNDVIDDNLDFFNLTDLINTQNQFFVPLMVSVGQGYSTGYWQGGLTDHYVGLALTPDGLNLYYGWVRCDVALDGSTITIKDYAYNVNQNEAIFAGQGSPSAVESTKHESGYRIFCNNNIVNVFSNSGKIEGALFTVNNTLGETILRHTLHNTDARIDLSNLAAGTYIVSLENGQDSFAQKIFIE